jgi:hypothetical protein
MIGRTTLQGHFYMLLKAAYGFDKPFIQKVSVATLQGHFYMLLKAAYGFDKPFIQKVSVATLQGHIKPTHYRIKISFINVFQ